MLHVKISHLLRYTCINEPDLFMTFKKTFPTSIVEKLT